MGRNSDRWSQRRRQRLDRWSEQWNDRLPSRLNELRLRVRRSPNGLALGVFRGIAESFGFSVCWTRVIGCFGLLVISGDGHGSLLVAGFFYLLAAVLMGRPNVGAGRLETPDDGRFGPENRDHSEAAPMPPPPVPISSRASRRAAAVPYQQAVRAPRVDFAALDRQLDGLNRRIQRMEGIVTDRHYDWDRRMES